MSMLRPESGSHQITIKTEWGRKILRQRKQGVQNPRRCCFANLFFKMILQSWCLWEKLQTSGMLHWGTWEEEPMLGARSDQQRGQVHQCLGFASFCSSHINLAFYEPTKFLFYSFWDKISTVYLNIHHHTSVIERKKFKVSLKLSFTILVNFLWT